MYTESLRMNKPYRRASYAAECFQSLSSEQETMLTQPGKTTDKICNGSQNLVPLKIYEAAVMRPVPSS